MSHENKSEEPKEVETTRRSKQKRMDENFIEGIDDLEDDIRDQLPNQDHCTWLLNIIRIHAKKMAKELLEEYKSTEFLQLREELNTLKRNYRKDIDELTKRDQMKSRQIERLQQDLHLKDTKLQEMLIKVDLIEQEQYGNEVQLVGLPELQEDVDDVTQVLQLAEEKMGLNIPESEITDTIRLGKRKHKPRDLLVKFKTKQMRETFYDQRKKTASSKKISQNVYINDRLTRHRKELFYSARHLFKRNKIAAAWTQQGNVLIRAKVNDPPKQVFSLKDLHEFTMESVLQNSDSECGEIMEDSASVTTHTISDYDFSDPGSDE